MESNAESVVDPHAAENSETVVAGQPGGAKPDSPAFKASDDRNLVEYDGKKYIREEALQAERTRAANYAKTLQQLEPLMPEFEQFLSARQAGNNATVSRATRSAAGAGSSSDYSDDELTGYAITRGYYDGDNKPDTKRAKDDLDIMTAIADRRATRAVKPLSEFTVRDKAQELAGRAVGQRFVDGEPIADERYVRSVFESVPAEQRADESVSNVLMLVAAGLQALDERRSGKAPRRSREPMFREGGGGRLNETTEGQLDALDRAAARARGKTPDQWAKMSKAIGGGASFGGTVLDEV